MKMAKMTNKKETKMCLLVWFDGASALRVGCQCQKTFIYSTPPLKLNFHFVTTEMMSSRAK